MGALYTNTTNAIRFSERITGPKGKPGFIGPTGPKGNKAVYLPYDPTTPEYATGIANGSIIPKDSDGNKFPTTVGGTWPNTGDKFINSLTGAVYAWNGTKWVANGTNVKGIRGLGNFVKSEVSFNGIFDNQGFTVSAQNQKTLVGHIIYPGKAVSGPINNVQVLVQTSSGGNNLIATVYLVNLGNLDAGIDDIVVAQSSAYLNGKGDDTSWSLLNLTVYPDNVPSTQEIFGLFVLLRADKKQETTHISNLGARYGAEAASAYTTMLKETEATSKEVFYKILDAQYQTKTIAETPAAMELRRATEAALSKKALIEQEIMIKTIREQALAADIPYDPFASQPPVKGATGTVKQNPWQETPITYATRIKVAHLLIS